MKRKVFLTCFTLLLALVLSAMLVSCSKEGLKAPSFEITDPVSHKTEIEFEIRETDPDNVGEIKSILLFENATQIKEAEKLDTRKFDNLKANTTYTVKVIYSYDLQDGEGERTGETVLNIKTLEGFTSKTDIRKDWEGKTLNVACSTYSGSARAPWSVLELCVDYGKESGFGTIIDASVLERNEFIKNTYGVKVNWINATRYSMYDFFELAAVSKNFTVELALPRMMNAQTIVANGHVYDLNNREIIDFSNPYYNQSSVEAYTAKGHTFFVDGEFSIISKETAGMLYFNKELLGGEQATADLYKKVREGKWTWSEMITLSNSVVRTDDGEDGFLHNPNEVRGLCVNSYDRLFGYFGVNQAGVDKSTGEWRLTLKDSDLDKIVNTIIETRTGGWAYASYEGCYCSSKITFFEEGRILFCESTPNLISSKVYFPNESVGVVPFPMLSEEQGRYYSPVASHLVTLMCIPKYTQSREMSEYFLDVLSWTGGEYTVEAYLEQKAELLVDGNDIEMLKDYIFPNIIYDPGTAVQFKNILGNVLNDSHRANKNRFTDAYAKYEPDALNTIEAWNTAWGAYKE